MPKNTKLLILAMAAIMLLLTTGFAISEPTIGTIGWAKILPDGTVLPVPITGAITDSYDSGLTSVTSYIESIDGSSGIKIDAAGIPGQIVEVTGTIITTPDTRERMITGAVVTPTRTGKIIRSVGMNNKAIGGGNFGQYLLGLPGGSGLNNVGLLITTWGKVTATGEDYVPYFYMDDGSKRKDGTTDPVTSLPNIGVRVNGYNGLYTDEYVGADGISSQMQNIYNSQVTPVIELLYTPATLSPPTPIAMGGNGVIFLVWNGEPAASSYRIYRSATQTGTFSKIGEIIAPLNMYLDKPLSNGTTYWYEVTSVSGNLESAKSAPVSATSITVAPALTINSTTIDSEGILTVAYSLTQGTGGNPPMTITFEIDGEEQWDEDPTTAGGNWVYDTTQLPNGQHSVGIRVLASDNAANRYIGYDRKQFSVNNFITNLDVSEIIDGLEPFKARLGTVSDWTITVRQGGAVLASSSGTGTEVSWLWDAAGSYEDEYVGEAEVEISYHPTGQFTGKADRFQTTASTTGSKIISIWVTTQSRIPRNGQYQWANWYAKDQRISTMSPWQFASDFFKTKFNQPVNSNYNFQMTQPDQFTSILLPLLQDTDAYNLTKISHVVWSGHGNIGGNSIGVEPNFLQAAGWYANMVGYGDTWTGLTPFNDYADPALHTTATAIGPRIGNRAVWQRSGPGRGRPHIYQLDRRFKFAVVFGCWSARNTMPLALGIPKKQYPGCRCAYIGFKEMLWFPDPAGSFSVRLFNSLGKGEALAKAFSFASGAFTLPGVTPPEARLSNPILFGDPNMKVGRNTP